MTTTPADSACWIWHPDIAAGATAILRFRLRFTLSEPAAPLIHVSADQRFQLRCDAREVAFGPDRCDVEHWTSHSVRLELAAGVHELEATVWWLAGSAEGTPVAPMAQISWRGGFILAAQHADPQLLDTGTAPWTVQDLTAAVALTRPNLPGYHDVGPEFDFEMARWDPRSCAAPAERPAAVILPALQANPHGVQRPGWRLYPAELPEQHRETWTGGRIRAVRGTWPDALVHEGEGDTETWQRLLDDTAPVTLAPHSTVNVLWDLGRYRCAYPSLAWRGGAGARVEAAWAESLYQETDPAEVTARSAKGNRDQVEGKVFTGMGDRWRLAASEPDCTVRSPSLWWRAGRYVRLRISTADEPLTVAGLELLLTGYPLSRDGAWASSDESWDRLMPLFENSYRVAAHEVWTDSPYYEQMSYVGDTLLSARSNYAWFGDDRLSRRALRLFDWSRRGSGLVAERYPSAWRQESATYALLWPIMVRDFAWWRDDPAFVRDLLPGVRSLMAQFDHLAGAGQLLGTVPGWPFVDWVPQWHEGCGPGVREGDSSIVNLHWVLALLATADLEQAHGDPVLAHHGRARARRVFDRILNAYWDESRGMVLDSRASDEVSEHAQVFALLTGFLDAERTRKCLAALRRGKGLARMTIYASHYLLEALYLHHQGEMFHRRLEFWRALPGQGFTATPEMPEPSRSDAHAWGAHPAWHTLSSIAGVRPDAPGFRRVRVEPMPGPLTRFTARVVHPRGVIGVEYRRLADGHSGYTVTLPDGISGTLHTEGRQCPLVPGVNTISIC
jgi:hypothetical protein